MAYSFWRTLFPQHATPDVSELAQARFRVLNVSSFCVYMILAWYFKWLALPVSVPIGAAGYIGYSLLWLFLVSFSTLDVRLRRTTAALLDQALPALGMYLAGFDAALVAWVPAIGSIGSGLRFGTRYTWISSLTGGPLMAAAFYFSAEWQTIPAVCVGILMCNVLLPFYVVYLVKQLEDAKHAFERRAAHFEAATKLDTLTGLLNRTGFADVLDDMLAAIERQRDTNSAVLLLDLDGFKTINDTCGHATGDEVLKAVAAALSGCLRIADHVARLGGDEFGVSLRHLADRRSAELLATQMLEAIAAIPMPVPHFRLGASIGICVLPHPQVQTRDEILHAADRLMYEAKAAGKSQYRVLGAGLPHADLTDVNDVAGIV